MEGASSQSKMKPLALEYWKKSTFVIFLDEFITCPTNKELRIKKIRCTDRRRFLQSASKRRFLVEGSAEHGQPIVPPRPMTLEEMNLRQNPIKRQPSYLLKRKQIHFPVKK
jgi:hypothetical protein